MRWANLHAGMAVSGPCSGVTGPVMGGVTAPVTRSRGCGHSLTRHYPVLTVLRASMCDPRWPLRSSTLAGAPVSAGPLASRPGAGRWQCRSAATAPSRRWCRPPPRSRRGPSGSGPATGRTAAGLRNRGEGAPLPGRSDREERRRWCRGAGGRQSPAASGPDTVPQ